MIKINNLVKTYKSRKDECHALVGVNLVLPKNGLVFVLGKSGSGKSTLLNLLGGLDSITSGEIIVEGNEISKYNERELSNYRNNHVGFIFQDYHLIEEMTVKENIQVALDLRRICDETLIDEALEKVGLGGFGNRYPSELSGGQQQRIAIARAIVKKPRVILADEPTGNLDNVTATNIIGLLKELSKECLILVVSHNTLDSYKYADRIIELSEGKIIKDRVRNPQFIDSITFDNNEMIYPRDHIISDNEIELINQKIENNELSKVIKFTENYIEDNSLEYQEVYQKIENNTLSFRKLVKLSGLFLKNKIVRIIITSIMVAAIVVILSLGQTIIQFEPNVIIEEQMSLLEQESLLLDKMMSDKYSEMYTTQFYGEVEQKDIEQFKNSGYDGDIRKIFNYCVPANLTYNYYGIYTSPFATGLYLRESIGTIIVDEQFLKSKFGEINYLAKVEDFHPLGVVITDYMADCILKLNTSLKNKGYEDIIGGYEIANSKVDRIFINGIIKTNYKEKYKSLFEKFIKNPGYNVLYEDKDFIDFSCEIYDALGLGFSLNPNLVEDFKGNIEIGVMPHQRLVFNNVIPYMNITNAYVSLDLDNKYELVGNEVVMSFQKYNEIFGTSYDSKTINSFVPHNVKIAQYRYSDQENKNKLLEVEVTIKKLVSTSGLMYVSEEMYKQFSNNGIFSKGLYFEGINSITDIINKADSLDYEQRLVIIEGIHTMTRAVEVFIPIFELINIVLCIGIIGLFVSFTMKMIKDKLHEIGILKAIGAKNFTILIIFGIQILLIAIVTSITSVVGYALFIDIADNVLIESLNRISPGRVVLDLNFLSFKWNIGLFNAGMIFALAIISLIVPMVTISNIKPVKIINSQD